MPVDPLLTRARAFVRSYLTAAGRRAAGNLLGLTAYTLAGQASAAGTVFVLTRALGPEQFGVFAFAQAVQSYLFLVGSGGCRTVVLREAARRPEDLDQILTCYLAYTAALSLTLAAATAAVAWGAGVSAAERGLVTALAVGNVAACANLVPLFDAQHQQARGAAVNAAAEVLTLAAFAALSGAAWLTLPAVGCVFAAKWALTSAGQCLVYHRRVRPLRLRFEPRRLREFAGSSWPLLLAVLVSTVPLHSGVIFVRLLATDADAGVYGLAYQVAYAYLLLAMLGSRVLQPHILGPYGRRRAFVRRLALFAFAFLGALGLAVYGAAFVVVRVALAPAYRDSLTPAAFLVAGVALFLGGHLAGTYLVALRRERVVLLASAAAAALYVAGCLALTPVWAYNGPAVMSAGALLAGASATVLAVRHFWGDKVTR
jgi:O-antigen/teichoic acid export membrane protein